MTFTGAILKPARSAGAFILDNQGDEQLLFTEDLERLRRLIDQVLPRQAHNHEPNDPDGHIVFDSVCCGAKLYRCSVEIEGLPSKPIIFLDEPACASCGADLVQF